MNKEQEISHTICNCVVCDSHRNKPSETQPLTYEEMFDKLAELARKGESL